MDFLKKIKLRLLAFTMLILCSGCPQAKTHSAVGLVAETSILEAIPPSSPSMKSFPRDVKRFYQNLHNKNWAETYKQLNFKFRNTVSEELYVKKFKESSWSLLEYEVLNPIQIADLNKVIIMCKFIEGPGEQVAYNYITWTYEDGIWRCDCAGPRSSPFSSRFGEN